MKHTPDNARDKIELLHAERDVDERVAGIFDQAVGVVMARFCYSREEAEAAGRIHFAAGKPRKRPRKIQAEARV